MREKTKIKLFISNYISKILSNKSISIFLNIKAFTLNIFISEIHIKTKKYF